MYSKVLWNVLFQHLPTEVTNEASAHSTSGDIVELALQAAKLEEALSPNQLMTSLRHEEAKCRHLKRLLQNQYTKLSRHSKYHNQMVAGFQSELAQLKKSNEILLAEKKTFEEAIEKKNSKLASQGQAIQSAIMDANFFELLLSSRDKRIEELEQEKHQLLKDLVAIKSQLETSVQ